MMDRMNDSDLNDIDEFGQHSMRIVQIMNDEKEDEGAIFDTFDGEDNDILDAKTGDVFEEILDGVINFEMTEIVYENYDGSDEEP